MLGTLENSKRTLRFFDRGSQGTLRFLVYRKHCKDAYFHIHIRKCDRKWLRFAWKGFIFQYKVLPFGLSLSPWAFTRLVRDLL